MINILVASDDTARLTQIARLVADCGHSRATRATGRPSQIEHRTDGSSDVPSTSRMSNASSP